MLSRHSLGSPFGGIFLPGCGQPNRDRPARCARSLMTSAVKRSSACLCCSASPAKALSGLTGGASVFFGNNIMVGVFSAIILNALFVALPDWWRSIVRRRPWMFQQPIRRMGLALRRTMNDNAG